MGMRYYNLTKQNEVKSNPSLKPVEIKEEKEYNNIEEENEWGEGEEENRMLNKNEMNDKSPVEQLMKAIEVFTVGYAFHENASLDSHKLGLQGFKRLHRYFSRKDNEVKMKLEHYCIDMFGEKVTPEWKDMKELKTSHTVKEMLESYLEHENEKYALIAETANILTMNEFLHESHILRKELEPVTREIIKCKS